jgi:hypothetical protein
MENFKMSEIKLGLVIPDVQNAKCFHRISDKYDFEIAFITSRIELPFS